MPSLYNNKNHLVTDQQWQLACQNYAIMAWYSSILELRLRDTSVEALAITKQNLYD